MSLVIPGPSPSQKSTVTFLFLDESLGEYGTDWWIGRVEFGRDKLAASIPLEELTSFVESAAKERGWKKHLPGELWTLYKTKQSSADFPRSDILTRNTCIPKLFTRFMESAGQLVSGD